MKSKLGLVTCALLFLFLHLSVSDGRVEKVSKAQITSNLVGQRHPPGKKNETTDAGNQTHSNGTHPGSNNNTH